MNYPLQDKNAALVQGVTASLTSRIGQISYESLPAPALTVARQCVLDWIAVTLRATDEPLVRMLYEQAVEDGGAPKSSLLGRNQRVSARQAALINGAASHALDYDDVNIRMTGHPTVAVLPAALALAESRGASGKALIEAFAAGYETVCLVGGMVSPSHYRRGFHVTGTVGTLGAAAAGAKLLGLDHERTRAALGIAATQAAGLKAMFGTMCKPLHAGKASENGLLAAQLAARGFTSNLEALECEQGFAQTQSDTLHAEVMTNGAQRFNLPDNLFKYHASCYQTHAAIDGIRGLRAANGFTGADIEKIVIRQDAGADKVCNIASPVSGLETKFSLRMLAAYAVMGLDTSDIDSYTDEHTRNPALVALRDKVSVTFTPGWPITRSEVQIHLKDGRHFSSDLDSGRPELDLDLQTNRLLEKMFALAEPRLSKRGAREVADAVMSLDQIPDVRALTDMLRPVHH